MSQCILSRATHNWQNVDLALVFPNLSQVWETVLGSDTTPMGIHTASTEQMGPPEVIPFKVNKSA